MYDLTPGTTVHWRDGDGFITTGEVVFRERDEYGDLHICVRARATGFERCVRPRDLVDDPLSAALDSAYSIP